MQCPAISEVFPLFSPKTPFFKILIFDMFFICLSFSNSCHFGYFGHILLMFVHILLVIILLMFLIILFFFPFSSYIFSLTLVVCQSLLKQFFFVLVLVNRVSFFWLCLSDVCFVCFWLYFFSLLFWKPSLCFWLLSICFFLGRATSPDPKPSCFWVFFVSLWGGPSGHLAWP